MVIELPNDADALLRRKAAAAGFGDDIGAYVVHLVTTDRSGEFGNKNRDVNSQQTAYGLALQLGIIGMSGEGPSDLATNPKYMEGFGGNALENSPG